MEVNFNKLTPGETERLAILSEELGEAQQAIGKILRHGYRSHNPDRPSAGTNQTQLERELGDVWAAILLLDRAGDVDWNGIHDGALDRRMRFGRYAHHQDDVISTGTTTVTATISK